MTSYTCKKSHPYGVKTAGNIFFADSQELNVRPLGLGRIAVLNDTNVIEILSSLNGIELSQLSVVSRAMYVYSHHSDLWRDLVLRVSEHECIAYHISWKDTYVKIKCKSKYLYSYLHQPLVISGIYSEMLYRSWCCSSFDFQLACPGFLTFSDIPRRDASQYSIEKFLDEFEMPNKPVILTNLVSRWPAIALWTDDYLSKCCSDIKFRTTSPTAPLSASFTLPEYIKYMTTTTDEAPLYLFDRDYSNIDILREHYNVPSFFAPEAAHGADLFRLLGEKRRPDYRWLVMGPARSGSIFHIDPNQTNAWNAAIRGRKKWIFYPPSTSPPGVFASDDGGDVTVPLTTAEWLLTFWEHHLDARMHPDPSKRPLEVVMNPGELIFVPHNWWHMVVNLDDCIALTHNYVSSSNLVDCLRFLREKPDQVSGIRDRPNEAVQPDHIYLEFCDVLKEHYPELYNSALSDSLISLPLTTFDSNEKRKKKNTLRRRKLHEHSESSSCPPRKKCGILSNSAIVYKTDNPLIDERKENIPFSFQFKL